jgi:mannitol/fructose-specific phosphotransferase system IIA component (Ntr-type)
VAVAQSLVRGVLKGYAGELAATQREALARISRLMLDEDFKTALEKAQSAKEAYDLLSERETR